MKFFCFVITNQIPGGHRKAQPIIKNSKLKVSATLETESSTKIISDKKIQSPKKILQKKLVYQTQLTKQIIKTRYDLNKIQTDLTKVKGDLEC